MVNKKKTIIRKTLIASFLLALWLWLDKVRLLYVLLVIKHAFPDTERVTHLSLKNKKPSLRIN